MRSDLMPAIMEHIRPLRGFEAAKLLEIKEGYCKFSIQIQESMLTLYGSVHGGVLFTLCDMAAGMATYAYGVRNVTFGSDIHFMKGISSGTLYVEGRTMHMGKRTSVCQVGFYDEDGNLLVSSTMSMFILGEV